MGVKMKKWVQVVFIAMASMIFIVGAAKATDKNYIKDKTGKPFILRTHSIDTMAVNNRHNAKMQGLITKFMAFEKEDYRLRTTNQDGSDELQRAGEDLTYHVYDMGPVMTIHALNKFRRMATERNRKDLLDLAYRFELYLMALWTVEIHKVYTNAAKHITLMPIFFN